MNSGFALVMMLIVLQIVTLLGLYLLTSSSMEMKLSQQFCGASSLHHIVIPSKAESVFF